MEKKISYLNKTYADYKKALIEMSEKYYPDLSTSFNDASVAAWQIDVAADIADNLSYHIDRVYQETNIDSAQERASLYAIARNNGVKIPGPKGAMAEMRITVTLTNLNDGPIIKRGTRFSSSSQQFELLSDVDFNEQFDENGVSNRTVTPSYNTNGVITGHTVSKLAVVTAGETRVYRQVVRAGDIRPFMEILIPVENVMNVESVLVVAGDNNTTSPNYGAFYSSGCTNGKRFYEVDNFAQGYAWVDSTGQSYQYTDSNNNVVYSITKGEWKPITHKFITEYTDKGYLKVIFGAGDESANTEGMNTFSKWQISKILNNNNLGVLPSSDSTIFVLYRVGGGKASNVPKGAINRVSYLNAEFRGTNKEKVLASLKVENTTPSVSGKDMPSEKEINYLIKYHNAAQQRCVTVKDYINRILMLPPKYGTPFRVGAMEENNKIMIYLLGIDSEGKLDTSLPVALIKNIEDYLSAYRMINDYVEIKSGRIINLSFDVEVISDKNYNKTDVIRSVIDTIIRYMDINNHLMGEEIYVGDLQKEIGKVDGVISLISLKIYDESDKYSSSPILQEAIDVDRDGSIASQVDLEATDGILYNDGDSMMEIKDPLNDIKVRLKER